ncbi:MAG: TspO/MBR family protein [Planctomycetota bacterium]|nr:TspO/MBR family protein [Planctomycetota bacterium]
MSESSSTDPRLPDVQVRTALLPPSSFNRFWQTLGLVIALTLCLAAGGLGSLATTPKIDGWYATIVKPSWNPPAAVFGPVWTVLYIMMGISTWLVWRNAGWGAANPALLAFGVQLILNTLWSFLFFGLENPGLAAIGIELLWLAILVTIILFWRHSRAAAWLLVPYLAWVTFASALNFTIWQLNR